MHFPDRDSDQNVYLHDAYADREDARSGSDHRCVKVQPQRNHAGQNR